jgi:hypothetical protein
MKIINASLRTLLAAAFCTALASAGTMAAGQQANGETDAAQVKKELSEAIASLQDYGAERRDEAYQKAKNALDTADEFIEHQQDNLSEAWSDMSDEAREKKRSTMRTIREQRRNVAEWLGGMKAGTKDAWVDLRDGFKEAFDDLAAAISDATESDKMGAEETNAMN